MNLYIAAPWDDRYDIKHRVAPILRTAGHTIVSQWHDMWGDNDEHQTLADTPLNVLASEACRDLDDLREADAVVVLNTKSSEGKAFEQGYAYALDIPLCIVGPRTNVFHAQYDMNVFTDLDALLMFFNVRDSIGRL